MSTIRGFGVNEIKAQPGFTARQTENGGWVGRHSFAIKRSSWANASVRNQFAKGTPITSIDPDLEGFFSFLGVVETEVMADEGDFMMIGVDLAGAGGAQYGEGGLSDTAEPTYRLTGSLQDAPFSLHPKWVALSDTFKWALGKMIKGEAEASQEFTQAGEYDEEGFFTPLKDETDASITFEGDAIEFCKRIAQGETTYLRPTLTWTETTQGTDKLTASQLNALGNVSTPRGDPPEPTGGRNWMLTSAMQEEAGEQITTDLEWTLSEKGGHDSFLYEE